MGRRSWGWIICALVLASAGGFVRAADDLVPVMEAELVHRFTQFIEWPSDSKVSDSSTPFVIGVVGDSPIRGALQSIATQERILGKRIQVRSVKRTEDVGSCNILVISRSGASQASAMLGAAEGRGILTIGDRGSVASRDVMINFFLEGEYIRFTVNPKKAERNGLRFAPELLTLGRAIDS